MISELDPNIKHLLPLNRAQKTVLIAYFFPFFLHISIKSSLNNKNMRMDADAIHAMPYIRYSSIASLSLESLSLIENSYNTRI